MTISSAERRGNGSTKSTAGNAEGFLGRLPPHPAAVGMLHGLLVSERTA